MKPAYLMMVHHKPEQFEWLLNAVLHPEGRYLIHVDLKTWSGLKRARRGTAARVRDLVRDHPNVRLMRPRSVNWGGWSQSQLALDAIDQLLAMDADWTHFINLSGQCYPLRPSPEIRDTLAPGDRQFVELRPWSTLPADDWHLRWIPMLETPVRAFALPGRRSPPTRFRLSGKGSQWVMLTRAFCEWRRTAPVARRIIRYLRWGLLSDELIFQALLENSPFADQRADHYGRHIVWPGPKVLTASDLPAMRNGPGLYGRKFDAAVDVDVLHALAQSGGYRPGPSPLAPRQSGVTGKLLAPEPAMFDDTARPAATILIPAYNAARYIEGTLASAAAQTERNLEILVVDDCSTDETPALVRSFAEGDARVRLLRTPRNGGPAAACNLGIEAARGDWIAILDADDTLEPERMARLIALGAANGADMCADNLLSVYEDGERPPEPMLDTDQLPSRRRLSLTDFIEGNLLRSEKRVNYGFLQPMFRRAFLHEHGLRFDEQLRFAEDYTFYVACLKAGASWWITPEPMYRYLIRKGSLTEVQTSRDLDRLRQLDRRLLADPIIAADRRLSRALRRHRTEMDRSYYYRAFTDAVKAGRWRQAGALLLDSSSAAVLIGLEGLRQAPVIIRKALRGGYRRSAAVRPASGLLEA